MAAVRQVYNPELRMDLALRRRLIWAPPAPVLFLISRCVSRKEAKRRRTFRRTLCLEDGSLFAGKCQGGGAPISPVNASMTSASGIGTMAFRVCGTVSPEAGWVTES